MPATDPSAYIFYLLAWRLSIVFCGMASIYLGYRLFVLGFDKTSSDIEATYGNYAVKFGNFAPGTAFALFGATLVGIMVATSPAEVVMPAAGVEGAMASGAGGGLILRGD
jgi:hypothetical protein